MNKIYILNTNIDDDLNLKFNWEPFIYIYKIKNIKLDFSDKASILQLLQKYHVVIEEKSVCESELLWFLHKHLYKE